MRLAVAASLTLSALFIASGAHAVGVPGQGSWETTLLGRDIHGQAVAASSASAVFLYDNQLDITWLRNASVNGRADWAASNTWAKTVVVGDYAGWRLPTMVDSGLVGCDTGWAHTYSFDGEDCGYNVDTRSSEMAHLFYVTLGNRAAYDTSGQAQPSAGLTNTGDFVGLEGFQSSAYWSGLQGQDTHRVAWYFGMFDGFQGDADKAFTNYAMAVHSGDVALVPEPSTAALILAGLIAVGGWRGSKLSTKASARQ